MRDLDARINQVLQTHVLLVAADFDGTLAPIVEDPALARPHPASLLALEALTRLPCTHAAVVSGRSLADLSNHLTTAPQVHRIGSHGAEPAEGLAQSLSVQARELLGRLVDQVEQVAARTPGSIVERKPAGVAFHYRSADASAAAQGVENLLRAIRGWSGTHVRLGKMLVELDVVATNKGCALQQLRQRLGATAIVFIGDDLTDEDAFAMLGPTDLGIKVGEGPSMTDYRLPDTIAVSELLARLLQERSTQGFAR